MLRICSVTAATFAFVMAASAVSAKDSLQTVITVKEMHCEGCAQSIVSKVKRVPGVAKVMADVETKSLTIVPKSQMVLSPKALWEAVEKANKIPVKIEGPSGVFTKKPQT